MNLASSKSSLNVRNYEREKMRHYFTLAGVIILAILLSVMVGVSYNQKVTNDLLLRQYREDSVARIMQTRDLEADIVRERNRFNQERAEKEIVISEKKYFQDLSEKDRKFLDEFLQKYNLAEKNLIAAQRFVTKFEGEFKTFLRDSVLTTITDTVTNTVDTTSVMQHYSYVEPSGWFAVSGIQYTDTLTGQQVITGKPIIREEYDVTFFKRLRPKKHFLDIFRKKLRYVQVESKNPYVTTEGMKTVFKER